MDPSLFSKAGEQTTRNLSIFAPVSPPAESIRNLSILVFAITGFIFLVVEGVLLYCLIRSRRRAAGDTTEPPQVYGSKPIEIAWTAAPALIVFILTLVTARSLWEVNIDPPASPKANDQALFITVVGRQWWWEYTYESYNGKTLGFTTANELHIPASEPGVARPVYLTLKSADVCHSFWVPRLAGKTDLIPGQTNSLWFQTEQTGLFLGQCAEFCGTQHANMLIRVVVDPPQDFDKWLDHEAGPAPDDPAVVDGKESFLAQTCVNCHQVRGTPARGTYAPDLTHLMSRRTLAAGMVPNTPDELRRWVDDPQQVKPGCLMPAFGLSKTDRDLIVGYLMTLR
jgi:cytochrome c oxidase subunit II